MVEFDAVAPRGKPARGVVVVGFPSERAVHDFEIDPEHGPVKDIRWAVTMDANAVMAPEFTPPTESRPLTLPVSRRSGRAKPRVPLRPRRLRRLPS